jgi:N-acetylglucosaminyldiphosphoundecaprenol N-acetyl-beta-D-mannosaminyltransferase
MIAVKERTTLSCAAGNSAESMRDLSALRDELSREVFGVFGIPLDNLDGHSVVSRIEQAVTAGLPFYWSTPNLNFLVLSQKDEPFRESLLTSDLCPPDGMALVWVARLIGIPVQERVAGSDIFDALKLRPAASRPIKVFLFGGAEGLAQFVAQKINAESKHFVCIGAISPHFGSVAELSRPIIIDEINASGADLLVVALSAKKGQEWLLHNHEFLRIPIRACLGATLNFQAGAIRRSPAFLQKIGLEWLWRIKEEPYLWRRYVRDGAALLRLTLLRIVPLLVHRFLVSHRRPAEFVIKLSEAKGSIGLEIAGPADRENVRKIVPLLAESLSAECDITIDLSSASQVDSRFFGLLVTVRKITKRQGRQLSVIVTTWNVRKLFELNGFDFLLRNG